MPKGSELNTNIWWRDRAITINPDEPPVDTRQLDGFLFWNGAPKCFVKAQGGWYKMVKGPTLLYVVRTLYLLSMREWLEIAQDENFTANIKV